ncbi:protein-tyrosine-phosphatase [Tersicoccus solisilvae]|uniref:Protein-tyrosine-phosphatase n=1 Tax=Tersicoccus solisilvae TaxID=1882339 RepID=A0ABQ1PN50_9MICC|nr:hypothetical protein [Tersicoccus solisilvae]GGC99825.1 protein-tyrosine-phosphatase [Tersicoccus solisilvae]
MNALLIVCSANVCRSRYAEQLVRDQAPSDWSVSSAGTHAADGSARCALVDRRLGGGHSGASSDGSARPLTLESIEAAQLVLTAERAHRTAVLQVLPEARSRTFTLREFVLLVDQFGLDEQADSPSSLAAALESLDHARPWLDLTDAGGPGWLRRTRRPDPGLLDVRDGHLADAWAHRRSLRQIEDAAARTVTVLRTWSAAHVPGDTDDGGTGRRAPDPRP